MGKLTALGVKAAKKPGKYYDGSGLVLVVKASGARSWIVRLQFNGKRRDFGLGSAKDVSLAEARELAADLRKKVRGGIDPVEEKRKANFQAKSIPTFKDAAETVHQEHKGSWRNEKNLRSAIVRDIPTGTEDLVIRLQEGCMITGTAYGLDGGLLPMLLVLLISVPIYMCASASTPARKSPGARTPRRP